VEGLKAELESVQNAPLTCLLSVGWGSGFLAKAGLLETENAAYRKILRSVPAIGKSLRDNVPFPKTRRIVFLKGQPSTVPGWVRIQFER
jgi:CRISPR-associated protein Csm5